MIKVLSFFRTVLLSCSIVCLFGAAIANGDFNDERRAVRSARSADQIVADPTDPWPLQKACLIWATGLGGWSVFLSFFIWGMKINQKRREAVIALVKERRIYATPWYMKERFR